MRIIPYDEFKTNEFGNSWKILFNNIDALGDLGNSYEWSKCWWETYKNAGEAKKDLFVLTDEIKNKIIAIWPLFVRNRYGIKSIHWIGQADGMITDYMAPVLLEQDKDINVMNFIEFLSKNASAWDVVDLQIPQWANLLTPLIKNFILYGENSGLKWKLNVSDHAVVVDLPTDFEKYLSQLGKKTRTHTRQYLRSAIKNNIHLEIFKGASSVEKLPILFELNSRNWQVFQSDLSKKFFLEVAGQFENGNSPIFLAVLSYKEEGIATVLGFEKNNTCYIHPAGIIRKQVSGISPGTTMYAYLIQSLIERGFKKLDLSPGLEEYKLRLGGNIEPVYQFLIWHKHSKIDRWRMLNWARKKKSEQINSSRSIRKLKNDE